MTGQPMIAAKAPRAKARNRNRLMASGAMGMAIGALMLAPHMARAQVTVPTGQAFQGNAQVVSGGATVVQTATQDTITVTTPQAVINWTPNDRTGTGTIDFLPEGLRGLFVGNSDFTVLNRIIPLDGSDIPIARMIALNGIIDSQINSATGLPSQGGSVWFYSPGGILIGGTSVINVGSLLVTSRDIDTTGGLFAPDGTIRFRNPSIAGANGAIDIDVLAQINARNATPGSAYVAMVAPRIVQAGTVRSDGAIALVAAEEADIRINRGLFDIVVTTGTSDANGIIHTGSSTGPSDVSAQYESRAYLVAVPKNQAMTMLLSGTIGFETASSVSIAANGGILLSAGGNVLQGALVAPPATAGVGNISITDSRFANNFAAVASGAIVARPNQSCAPLCSATNPAGQLLFGGNAAFAAPGGVSISVGQAQRISVAGNLLILSARPGQGGSVSLTIDNAAPPSTSTAGGGVIQVAGAILLDASAGGNPVSGAATGGTASLSVNGGTLSAAAISVLASAASRVGSVGDGADATGGSATVTVENAGQLTTGALSVSANGTSNGVGRDVLGNPFVGANGGDGRGGTATIVVDNASLTAINSLDVSASGNGGIGSVTSGDGFGGTASISVDNDGGPTLLSSNAVTVSAIGQGGGSGFDPSSQGFFTTRDGGNGTGGRASFAASDTFVGDVDLGSLRVDASATGGSALDSSNPPLGAANGGNAQGGIATFALTGAAANATIDSLSVFGNASGGSSVSSVGAGGNGTGGSSGIALAAGATLESQFNVFVQSNGSGGEGIDVSGNGTGGTASANFAAGSTLDGSILFLSATGFGGGYTAPFQSFSPTTTIGGDGTGGLVTVDSNGTLDLFRIELDASGNGGSPNPAGGATGVPTGGDAIGGISQFRQAGGAITAAEISLRANATAGSSGTDSGTTGSADGGSASFASSNGTTNATDLTIEAIGLAASNGGGAMLTQQGGSVSLTTTGGLITIDGRAGLDASAGSFGGGFADTAELASGGTVTVDANSGGTISSGIIELRANADASGFGTVGGDAAGGTVNVLATGGSSISTLSGLTATASGIGGIAELGGQGTGGSIDLSADGGSLNNSSSIFLSADGESGQSLGDFASPDGRGGSVTIRLTDNDLSQLTFFGVQVTADGRVGSSFSAFGPSTPAGGGDGIGGTVDIIIDGGTVSGASFAASANGEGTGGGLGRGGTIRFSQTGGDVTLDFLAIGASGFGGTSPFDDDSSDAPGIGGTGQGGTVTMDFTGGIYTINLTSADAGGRGGNGQQGFNFANGTGSDLNFAGDGGDGIGGSINVTIGGEAEVSSSFLAFSADGRGGSGGNFSVDGSGESYAPGRGGNGSGGTVTIDLAGGTATTSEISAFAGARGGDAGIAFSNEDGIIDFAGPANHTAPIGGNGTGGTASIRLAGTTVSGRINANATASGGEGGSLIFGFDGGTGQGGTAELIADGVDSGSILVDLASEGFGGRGGRAVHGAGGNGGTGFGGTVSLQSINEGVLTPGASSTISVSGRGGDGRGGRVDDDFAAVINGFDGGVGGAGFGGVVDITAVDGNLTIGFNDGQGLIIESNGVGGDGGDGADNINGDPLIATFGGNAGGGGSGNGGSINLRAIGGTLTTAGNAAITLTAGGIRGIGGVGGEGNITSTTDPLTGVTTFFGGNGFTGFDGFTVGGTVRLEAGETGNGPGLVRLSNVSIDIDGDISGRAELIDDSAGAGIALGALSIVNAGNPSTSGDFTQLGSGVYVRSRDGAITVGSDVNLVLDGQFRVDAFGTGGLAVDGGLTVAQRAALFEIVARHVDRAANATILADTITLAGRLIDLQTGTLLRADTGSVQMDALETTIVFDQLDAALDINLTAFGGGITGRRATAGSDLRVASLGNVSIDTVRAGDSAEFSLSSFGSLTIGDLTTISGYANLVGGTITLDTADINTGLTVRAQAGDADIGTVTTGAATDINALGAIRVGSITTTNDQVDPRNPSLGAAILLNAQGTVTLGNLSSADIVAITANNLNQPSGNSGTLPGGSSITATGAISIGTALDIDFGSADGASISLFSTGGDIRFGTTNSDFDTSMTATIGSISGNFATTDDGDATLTAGDAIALDNASIGDVLSLTAGLGGITLGTSISGYDTLIDSDGDVSIISATTTDIGTTAPTSTANIVITAAGTVDAASLTSAENISIAAAGLTNADSSIVAAGNVDIDVDNSALFGTLTAGSLLVDAGNDVSFGSSSTTGSTSLIAGTGVDGDSLVSSNGGVSVTSSGGVIDIGTARAAFDLAVANSGGGVTLGSATSTQSGIFIDAMFSQYDSAGSTKMSANVLGRVRLI